MNSKYARILVLLIASMVALLPVEAKPPIAKIGKNHKVKLEVAATPQQIERGLMFRTSMPEEQGMVFLFEPPQSVNFWMYNCFMSLDMLFVRNGKIVKIFTDVPPCKSKNPNECPLYPEQRPGIEVDQVVELNAGWAKRHDVHEGDTVEFEFAGSK
jgi:uncharacterized membrane protein (UPF0127 family)